MVKNAQRVPCLAFFCKNCPLPITLPLDDFDKLVPYRGELPTDDRAVILVCDGCKHADVYSPLRKSPYCDRVPENIECFHIGVTEIVETLLCAGEKNEFQVPVIVTWIDGRTEEEKRQIEQFWRGEHLRCGEGHSIPWPFGR